MKPNLSNLIELEKHSNGPRLRVAGQRVHHGASSILATAFFLSFKRTRPYAPLLLLFALHDRHDWRFWFAPGDPAVARRRLLKRKS